MITLFGENMKNFWATLVLFVLGICPLYYGYSAITTDIETPTYYKILGKHEQKVEGVYHYSFDIEKDGKSVLQERITAEEYLHGNVGEYHTVMDYNPELNRLMLQIAEIEWYSLVVIGLFVVLAGGLK